MLIKLCLNLSIKKMEEKDFFVGIYDPTDVRRNILESSKDIVSSFQKDKNLKKIRQDKLFLYEEMRNLMIELNMLIDRLNKKMPKSYLRKNEIKDDPSPEVKKLEKELRNIEKDIYMLK
jgi:hypothetical protein